MTALIATTKKLTSITLVAASVFLGHAVSAAEAPLNEGEKALNTEKFVSCTARTAQSRAPAPFRQAVERNEKDLRDDFRKHMDGLSPESDRLETYAHVEWVFQLRNIMEGAMNDCMAEISGQSALRLDDDNADLYIDRELLRKKFEKSYREMTKDFSPNRFDYERKEWVESHRPN